MYKKTMFLMALSFILLFASCFLLFDNSNREVHALDGEEVVTYTDTKVETDVSNLGNYAINSVEALNVSGCLVYKLVFEIRGNTDNYDIVFASYQSYNNLSYHGNYFLFNSVYAFNNQIDCNFAIRCLSGSDKISFVQSNILIFNFNSRNYYRRYIRLYAGHKYELYFSSGTFGGTYSNMMLDSSSDYSSRIFSQNFTNANSSLSDFVDMSSESNFSFSDFDFRFISSNSYTLSYFFSRFFGMTKTLPTQSFFNPSVYANFNVGHGVGQTGRILLYKNNTTALTSGSTDFFYGCESQSSLLDQTIMHYPYEVSYYFTNFEFLIYRPVYRTNNTLIIYNFDYLNFLNKVSGLTYRLRRDSVYYDCVYNGSLPNNYFIYLYNDQVANILYDEYISLFIRFSDPLSESSFQNGRTTSSFSLGFDFNFTYYNEPLVTSTGAFNYTFERPNYVEAHFSLVPPHIPVLEWVQNAFIFVMFYCPITSDLLKIVHLDEFIGGLMNVFAFEQGSISILGNNIGGFLWACIAFLIFYRLLQSFMPILWGSVKESYGDLTYNSRRYKSEQIKEKKETKYKKYLEKKKDKSQFNSF